MSNSCANECNISCFYAGIQSVDPQAVKRYTFQGMEIFAFIKSVNLSQPFLQSVCSKCNANGTNSFFPSSVTKLTVDANQMLAIGYSHIQEGFPIVLTIYPGVELIVRNGGKIAVFNDNSIVNYGCILNDNASLILESEDSHARLINNGNIALKSSFLVGNGLIFNNGRFNITCYSKFSLGKGTNSTVTSEDNVLTTNNKNSTSTSDNSNKQLTTLDFTESYSRFINGGVVNISSYSSFELEGTFINGKKGIACCFLDQICCVAPDGSTTPTGNDLPTEVVLEVAGNSRFTFSFGRNVETELINEITCAMVFSRESTILIQSLLESPSKNTLVNRGVITTNGETTFKGVNVDNYGIIQSTFIAPETSDTGTPTQTAEYNFAKCLFTCIPDTICRFSNLGDKSFLVIAPTCTVFFDGYNVLNYGQIGVGSKLRVDSLVENNDGTTTVESNVDFDGVPPQSDPTKIVRVDCSETSNLDVSVNGTLIFGYVRIDPTANRITLKNFKNITICPRSILMIGKNSLLDSANQPQVSALNQGTIFNTGLLQVNRNSEIINRPCPFTMNSEEFSIINGDPAINGTSRSNAIILVRKPNNGNDSGGFIKSVSALLYNGGKIQNTSVGILISWVGFEREEEDNFTRCNLVFGVQSRIAGTGKVRVLPYPDWSEWDQDCLNEYMMSQNSNSDLEYAF
jgi:hypothetical protein